jgi:opacity protein-like surface antigen
MNGKNILAAMYHIRKHVQINSVALRFCFLFLFLVLGAFKHSTAQSSDCEQTLNQAAQEFSAGHFYGIPILINPCLDKFTKEQKIRAYLLLTQVYMIMDDLSEAENSYLKLLKMDPEYIASEQKDPIDLVYLSKRFTTRPIFTPRVFGGLNTSMPNVITTINSDPIPIDYSQSMGLGFQVAAGLDWNISDHFSLCFDFSFNSKSYSTTRSGISGRDNQNFTENQTWIDVPLYLRYSRKFGRFDPYIYGGFAFNSLLTANGQAALTNNSENSSVSSEGTFPLLFKRNKSNKSLVFGIGTSYKMGRDFITVDLRYMNGLTNLAKIGSTFYDAANSQDLSTTITQYRLIGDVFKLDNFSISFGYRHPLYKPRKLISSNGGTNRANFFKWKKSKANVK